MKTLTPSLPKSSHHVALAGMTGSGKTWAGLEMMAARIDDTPWLIIDHKNDSSLAKLPAEKMGLHPVFLPDTGLHIIRPGIRKGNRQDLEDLLMRIFKRGRFGVYVDEGHLMGYSEAIRDMLVAGRDRKVPVMFTSQRASWIDPFVWSQSTFYRVFELQTALDVKRVEQNLKTKWVQPEEFHSWYWDGVNKHYFYLNPGAKLQDTIKMLENKLFKSYRHV